jgi:hypothetical protein
MPRLHRASRSRGLHLFLIGTVTAIERLTAGPATRLAAAA